MIIGEQVRALFGRVAQAYGADPGYRQHPEVLQQLHGIAARLDQPLRIALAGTLKSGKSTLLNAMVGEGIAPTDATEATRIVTWFRHGSAPRATANRVDGHLIALPILRGPDGLGFDVRQCNPDEIADIDVEWPVPELIAATIADTPGTSSLTPGVSERTLRLLAPADGIPRVDAVVFLLRTLNAPDIALLRQIGQLVGGSAGALGVIGVASRADEIGVGRIDAMLSAKDVATRYTAELDRTGVCQAVVPVSGLLALTARTLRQNEFDALQKLAAVDATELNKAMLSVDRFVRVDPGLPVDSTTRAGLLERFGLFGIRISMALLRAGVADSAALADELLERSGLPALRNVIDQHFAQRSDQLKAHTALLTLRHFVVANPIGASPRVIADIDPLLADAHGFEELRLLSQLHSRPTTLTEDEMVSLRRIIGGSGTAPTIRLGSADDERRAAFTAAQRWRRRSEHPLNDPFTTRACLAAVRSAEAVLAQL